MLRELLIVAAERGLNANTELLNRLNVYPVPDGDTGTNMLLTVRYILNADVPRAQNGASDSEVAEAVYRSGLLGAQGNSGLLLSYFYKGLARAVAASGQFDGQSLAAAFAHAREETLRAIPDPQEGTIITVYGDIATRLAEVGTADLESALAAALEQAIVTVKKTPSLLPVLREAGVVDSGGLGIALLLRAALDALRGDGDGTFQFDATTLGIRPDQSVKASFVDTAHEDESGFCSSFAVSAASDAGLNLEQLRAAIEPRGSSFLMLGDEQTVKIHVHAEDPGEILSCAVKNGVLSNIEITNMDLQTSSWQKQHQQQSESENAEPSEAVTTAVVAVVTGAGMASLYQKTASGGLLLVDGGEYMNPNVDRLLRALTDSAAEAAVVLPNNKNTIGVARQAAELAGKDVQVLDTTNMAAGLNALLEFDHTATLAENVAAYQRIRDFAHYGSIVRAVAAATHEGRAIRAGEWMLFWRDELLGVGESAVSVLVSAVNQKVPDAEVLSLYCGQDVPQRERELLQTRLEADLPRAEYVEVFDGGQPICDYLFSIEPKGG